MHNKLLLIIIIISFILGASTLTRGHDWGDDFAWYILQGKSILNGTIDQFMQTSAFTNNESTTYLGPLAYPWGYPLVLTPVLAFKGINPLALKLPALFFYTGFLTCLYLLVRTRLPQTENLLVVALFAFNPLLLQFLNEILSDIPFLFFSTLSLWLILKNGERGVLRNIGIGACLYAVFFLRATGVLLLGCFLLIEFFRLLNNRKDWSTVKQIILNTAIVFSVFIVLWVINSLLFPNGGASYFAQYAGMTIHTVKNMSVSYFYAYGSFFGDMTETGWRYLYYLLVIFFLIGAWLRRKNEVIFILFFVFWMIVHIAYPYWQGPRYIFPLLPIFIYFVFMGMKFVAGKLPEKFKTIGQWSFYGFWSLMILIFLFNTSVNAYSNLKDDRVINGPFDPYSKEVYQYIQEKTSGDSVIIFFKPRVMRLMTDRPSIMSTECDRMLKGDYLVLSKKVGENQQIPPERIDSCNLPLTRVLSNNRFIVYQIQK